MPTLNLNYSGEWVKWNVPNDVEVVTIEMTGGGASGAIQAGRITGGIRVKGHKVLWISIGRRGFQTSDSKGGDPSWGGGGGGGDGKNQIGGDGGGGASMIRLDKKDGRVVALAAGAGGNSGDNGRGGMGGRDIGEYGHHTGTSENVGDATGGTQNQGGKGGTVRGYPDLWGNDANLSVLGRGGRGAQSTVIRSHGGGGGGGGYHGGGGGHASHVTESLPGGGGAGGANFTSRMFGAQSFQGTGGTANGSLVLTWDTTHPPVPPQNITINGVPIQDQLATRATSSVMLRGTPDDPDSKRGVRMLVWQSKRSDFATHRTYRGTYDELEKRDKVLLNNLEQDTLYYLRIYTQSINGELSTSYTGTSYWTNRRPLPPTLLHPSENSQIRSDLNVVFDWTHNDPDAPDPQTAWEFRYWKMGGVLEAEDPSAGKTITGTGSANSWVVDAGTFKGNTQYKWQARTRDQRNRWSEWALPNSFYCIADTTPPLLLGPIHGEGVIVGREHQFAWKFLSPKAGATQDRADLRYRVVGSGEPGWTTLPGDTFEPGSDKFWMIPEDTFVAGVHYEWQVRSWDSTGADSDWSDSANFWGTATPGTGAGLDPIISGEPAPPLGEGTNRAFLFQRGGKVMIGEFSPLADITWTRRRDDVSTNTLHMNEWDDDLLGMLRSLRTWRYEVVVFREVDGVSERVAEGPITRIASRAGELEVEFRDVMAYLTRRIMRQGYNDAYRIVDGVQMGLTTVVNRAQAIIVNALAYDDPNLLAYLTPFEFALDAKQSRTRKDFSTTAWEEIDDLAAHAGLDYSVVGRRIVLFDTHRPVGRLPEMRNGDFSETPIITEYGAVLANTLAVTNNDGLYAVVTRGMTPDPVTGLPNPGPEGFIEVLVSAYDQSAGAGTERTLTREARAQAIASMQEHANTSIGYRYSASGPAPRVVRIPDNATLSPILPIGINQLVPGVWIPLRVDDGIQEVVQWQKLDSITVIEDGSGEKIQVVMSPAPNNGEDPDSEAAAEAARLRGE